MLDKTDTWKRAENDGLETELEETLIGRKYELSWTKIPWPLLLFFRIIKLKPKSVKLQAPVYNIIDAYVEFSFLN